ncbi:MAG: hypothetical protein K9J79_03655 [Desulfobacteraceae bacterium]|nr:hypothetical protein [Desulfobacteraceae bacterium]
MMSSTKTIIKGVIALVISFLFIGCATSQSKFSKKLYEADNLYAISQYVEINTTSSNEKWGVAPKLSKSLNEKFKERGYEIVYGEKDSIKINVHIENFNPGNQALRLSIGQIIPGVGGCSLDYNVEFLDVANEEILIKNQEKIRYSSFDPVLSQYDEYSVMDYLGGADTVTSRMVKIATEKILRSAECWEEEH